MSRRLFLAAIAILLPLSSTAEQADLSTLYNACTDAFAKAPRDTARVLAACEKAAASGVPSAQYVMGALLVNRGQADDVRRGQDWLEKAVSGGNVAAAYQLAVILVQKNDDESKARGRALFKHAVCAGLPAALAALGKERASKEWLSCPPPSNTDFTGEWVVAVKWDKAANATAKDSYKIIIDAAAVRVFVHSGDEWVEVKPGKFALQQHEQSLRISGTDSGWDFDGKWIETWTFDLLRTGPNEAFVAYLRTVNNPYLPAEFTWQTFAHFTEGTARRTKR